MSRRERAAQRAMIGLVAFLAVAALAGADQGTASDAESKQLTGTVTAVEPQTGRVSVITGCGHALRVMVFHAGSACRIEIGGVSAPLTSLKRGQIVVLRYHTGAQPYVAASISTPPPPDAGRRR